MFEARYLSKSHSIFINNALFDNPLCSVKWPDKFFPILLLRKKNIHTFLNTVFVKNYQKNYYRKKTTTIKNYVQVHPNTSTAVKNGRIDSYWPSHRASRKSDVPLSGNHDFRSYGPYGPYLYPNSYRWNAWMLTNSNVQLSAYFAIISNIASTTNGLVDITLFSLIPTRNTFIFSIFSFQFINIT